MQTGVISFCDRINYNVKSSDMKDDVLQQISSNYQISVLQRHWHALDEKGIDHLKRMPHMTCIRSNGNPYYMYFTKYEDVPIIYFIDKKVQPGYQKPRMLLGRGLWDDSLFNKTILDGEMVKDKTGSWVFLINDVMGYKGKTLWHETLPQRLEHAIEMLDTLHTPDPVMDCCTYHVKQFAHATQEGVAALMDMTNSLPYTSRGIYFWPFSAKYKPKLVNFDDNLIKSVVRKVKDTPDFRENNAPEVPVTTPNPVHSPVPNSTSAAAVPTVVAVADGQTINWLRKTEFPDVYDVYKNNGTHAGSNTRGSKIGVAYVPSLKVSKMLRSVFKDTTVAVYIPFVCEYQKDTDKWLPVRITSSVD